MNYKKIKTCLNNAIKRINNPKKRMRIRLDIYKKLL